MRLSEGPVGLRPLRRRDARAWREVRARNRDWLQPWEPTPPPGCEPRPRSFGAMLRDLRAQARAGQCLPFAITYTEPDEEHGGTERFVGQLTVSGITFGSARWGHIGYWIDRAYAGRGITPTAVALATDYCFDVLRLHRIEINIRPENAPSLRVVEKLGFRFEGRRPRYLHIDGDWRDHLTFALHAEEVPEGLLNRWRRSVAASRHRQGRDIAKSDDTP
ncbi:GNAT family N-acetyltransferase [Thermasporomyces composti]|uniref:Ribosomal-protein-alanine N-acetyltransferase n=1 Tax=Thermasporomyces composti TaxID=696763 RepID=A0A3D9V1V2_THECX|nr:ribosomal-protein-alanine N-acetyltransferase [Thermasporomyces composti]